MSRQNRVAPTGAIEAIPARGTLMGNRGILHDERQTLGTARWRHRNWVTCLLEFKNRKRPIMAPRRYTELFFMDEAVALAAGHRPCCECRRPDYQTYREAFARGNGLDALPSAKEMDALLHAARAVPRRALLQRFEAPLGTLPDGTFLSTRGADGEEPALWWQGQLLPWHPEGYDPPRRPPATRAPVTVLTPRPTVRALAAGYRPRLHPSAARPLS